MTLKACFKMYIYIHKVMVYAEKEAKYFSWSGAWSICPHL